MSDNLSNLDNGGEGVVIHYTGTDDIDDLITREDIIKNDKITEVINSHISKKQSLFFMPNDIIEDNRKDYILKIFGILMNGSKVEVNITGIDVFFDVAIPRGLSSDRLQNDLNLMLRDTGVQYNIEDIYAYPLHGFHTEKIKFKRIYTNNAFSRMKLIKIVKDQMNLETYSNDTTNYYRKAARENKLSLSDWVVIDNYIHNYGPTNNSPLCEHIFIVDKKNYTRLTDEKTRSLPKITKDRTLVMAWDIETYSSRKTGEVPTAEHNEDIAFMICLSIHWLHESDALYKICIVDKETESDTRWITIVCDTEINVLKAFAICWNHFKPDIFIGYNDSGYDWPFIVEKSEKLDVLTWMWNKMSAHIQYNQTSENIIKRYYNDKRRREIKINAEKTFYSQCLMVPGTISIDCLPCFMKIYPRLETNKYGTLKFYLQDNKLPTKVDLPIPTLWKYYESGNIKHMREIAYYCIVDTISVQRLFVKRNIITDYREVSTLAYVSLADSHYYAGGIKVCNLLCSYAWDCNILVNMKPKIHAKAEKYPGAYVFQPDKGMTPNIERLRDLKENPDKELAIANFAKDRPVSCLDFASLYPSLIMTYNLSPEKIIITKDEYYIRKNEYKLHDIDFDIGDRKIQAWSIMHENKEECMGLFPTILRNLFAKRKEMKGLLKKCTDKKELYELIFSKVTNSNYAYCIQEIIKELEAEINDLCQDIKFIPPGSTLEEEQNVRNNRKKNIQEMINIIKSFKIDTIQQDYDNVCFERNCIDKKQGALKIYMNTFYGETGNHLSPFFLLQLAGGVTSAGQANIKLAANYAKENGFGIKYGDSVMPYTPIIIKKGENISIVTISHFDDTTWNDYPEFMAGDSNRSEKEYLCVPGIKIWTHNGWANIKKFIRHKTVKKIYRIITPTGLVDVTEDHSLLNLKYQCIKPSNCSVGDRILHSTPMIEIMKNETGTIATNQLDAQINFITLQSKGYKVAIKYSNDIYSTILYELYVPHHDYITDIYVLHESYDGYVYDIETEFGTFHAGVGNIILKNTDSLYLTCPNKYFRECDYKYISGDYSKEEFYTAMVKISLRVIANFEQEINKFLEQNNGTKFLKMENEGCNFPCLFLGKKKYFGIQHLNEVNFKPKKLYIKGIEVIKQGKSGIEKEIGNTIMRTAVSLDNELDIMDIVKNILYDSVTADRWKFEDFIQTSSWKPTKDNKSVQCFMKRMKARHEIELRENERLIEKGLEPRELKYSPLEPGERFSYVIVKENMIFDLQGRKLNIKVGDIMEYAHIAKEENIEIDVVYYLIHYVIGICARFISSNDQFMPPESKISTMDDKKIDEYSVKMAKKMLEDYVKNLSGISKTDIIQKGKECKKLFKDAVQLCTDNMTTTLQFIAKGPLLKIAFAEEDDSEADIVFKYANKLALTIYKKYYKTFCSELCYYYKIDNNTGEDIDSNKAVNLYKHLMIEKNTNYSLLSKIEYDLRKQLRDVSLADISIKYKTDLIHIINKIQHDDEIDIPSYDLNDFIDIWYQIVGLELYKIQNSSIKEYLSEIKCKRTKITKQPTKKEINQSVEDIISKK